MSVFFHKYVHGSMYVNPGVGGVGVCACARVLVAATPYLLLLPSTSSLHSCFPGAAIVSYVQSILVPTSTNTHQEALVVILSTRFSDLP